MLLKTDAKGINTNFHCIALKLCFFLMFTQTYTKWITIMEDERFLIRQWRNNGMNRKKMNHTSINKRLYWANELATHTRTQRISLRFPL